MQCFPTIHSHYRIATFYFPSITLQLLPPAPPSPNMGRCKRVARYAHAHMSQPSFTGNTLSYTLSKTSPYTCPTPRLTPDVCVTLLPHCAQCECIPHRGHIVLHPVSYPLDTPCPCPAIMGKHRGAVFVDNNKAFHDTCILALGICESILEHMLVYVLI